MNDFQPTMQLIMFKTFSCFWVYWCGPRPQEKCLLRPTVLKRLDSTGLSHQIKYDVPLNQLACAIGSTGVDLS